MDKDPITGVAYPPDAIQRILHISPKVHVYRIPPINSTKGFAAASWTQNPADLIFTARLRVFETAIPPPASAPPETPEKVSTTILLEDPKTGALFAAAPYTVPAVVEQASDSSRFFAVRVVGEGGMKATLGIGFEERPEAFDFGVCLQDVRRVQDMDASKAGPVAPGRRGRPAPAAPVVQEVKKDYSLKEGEMITVNIGGRSRRSMGQESDYTGADGGGLFSIPPPPGKSSSSGLGGVAGGIPFLPPPPNAADVRADRRKSKEPHTFPKQTAEQMGFDDGEFGEFQ